MKGYLEGLVQSVGKALVSNETAKKDIERLRKARRVGVVFLEELHGRASLEKAKA